MLEQLKRVFYPATKDDNVEYTHLEVSKIHDGFELKVGRMYERPGITFQMLKQLGELFGTEEVDVDDYGYGGCETCDFGSDYGHEIQIHNPTQNVKGLEALIGQEYELK